jgi:hypothetical protein
LQHCVIDTDFIEKTDEEEEEAMWDELETAEDVESEEQDELETAESEEQDEVGTAESDQDSENFQPMKKKQKK